MASRPTYGAMLGGCTPNGGSRGKALPSRQPLVGSGTDFQQPAGTRYTAALGGTERQSLASERAASSQLRLLSSFGASLCSADAPGEQSSSDWGPRGAHCGECGAALPAVPPGPGLDSPPLRSGPRRWWFAYCDIVRRLPTPQRIQTPSTRPIESVPVERLLLAMSSKTAWRATVGDCNTPGKIERSTNGGASWKRVVRTGPAPIVRLGAEPSGDLFTIGGTRRSCSVRYVAYADDGTVTTSATTRPMCGSQLQRTATKSMGPAGQKPLRATVMPSASRRSTCLEL